MNWRTFFRMMLVFLILSYCSERCERKKLEKRIEELEKPWVERKLNELERPNWR